ncbi:MAG TPA: hypothetical protein VIL99_14060 [Ignavibacteria bacterium]
MNLSNELFDFYFGNDLQLVKNESSEENMGWFILEYIYVPRGYKIIFEHARLSFSIRVIDTEGAYTSLPKMIPEISISSALEKDNIDVAIKLLSTELKKDDICFFITKNDKQYKKENGKLIRIKYPFMK